MGVHDEAEMFLMSLSSSKKSSFLFKDKKGGNLHLASSSKGVKFERVIVRSNSVQALLSML